GKCAVRSSGSLRASAGELPRNPGAAAAPEASRRHCARKTAIRGQIHRTCRGGIQVVSEPTPYAPLSVRVRTLLHPLRLHRPAGDRSRRTARGLVHGEESRPPRGEGGAAGVRGDEVLAGAGVGGAKAARRLVEGRARPRSLAHGDIEDRSATAGGVRCPRSALGTAGRTVRGFPRQLLGGSAPLHEGAATRLARWGAMAPLSRPVFRRYKEEAKREHVR